MGMTAYPCWILGQLFDFFGGHCAIAEIAKKAIKKKTGARGLRSIIEALLLKKMFKLPTMDSVEEIVLDQSVVKNDTEPKIVHAKNKKTTAA